MSAAGSALTSLRRLRPSGLSGQLTSSALALMANTGLTSVLGLAFWVVASRLYSPEVLGQDTGLIAAMMLLSSLSELSLTQGIPRLLPQLQRQRRIAVLVAYATTGLVAVVLATVFVIVAPTFSAGFRFLGENRFLQALLVGSVVLWNVFGLQDAVLVAVRKAILVPIENAVFGVLKIVLVVALVGSGTGHGVLAAWLVAMVAVTPVINSLLFGRLLQRPTETLGSTQALPLHERSRVAKYLGADYAAALLVQGSTTLLPVLVLASLGHTASAYFYIAFTIAGTLNAVALALGTALVAEGAHHESALRRLARRTTAGYAALIVPAILLLIAAAPLLLSPFGTVYVAHAVPLLRVLLLGCIPQTLVTVYQAVERVRGRAGHVLRAQALAFGVMLALLVVLVPRAGLEGVGLAWLGAWTLTGFAVLPSLLSVVGSSGRSDFRWI